MKPHPTPTLPLEPVLCYRPGNMCYPEIIPGINGWLHSDTPHFRTITVSEWGLRRLLRFVYATQAKIDDDRFAAVKDGKTIEASAPEIREHFKRWGDLYRQACSIFCEGDLVMSRLFVTEDGSVAAHHDEDIDEFGIPPHERAPNTNAADAAGETK